MVVHIVNIDRHPTEREPVRIYLRDRFTLRIIHGALVIESWALYRRVRWVGGWGGVGWGGVQLTIHHSAGGDAAIVINVAWT